MPPNIDFAKNLFDPSKIKVVVRYKTYELKWDKLELLPNSRLGKIRYAKSLEEIQNLCDEVHVEKNELHFDRSPRTFENIIDYYYSRSLHYDSNLCVIMFGSDLRYWGIESWDFDTCCNFKFHEKKNDAMEHITDMHAIEEKEKKMSIDYHYGCFESMRTNIWFITENISTSFSSKVN